MLASTASKRKDLRYQLKIGFFIVPYTKVPYTKRDFYWSFWCQGWSNHQNEEKYWGNRAVEAVEAIEVAEADEVNEPMFDSSDPKYHQKKLRVIKRLMTPQIRWIKHWFRKTASKFCQFFAPSGSACMYLLRFFSYFFFFFCKENNSVGQVPTNPNQIPFNS